MVNVWKNHFTKFGSNRSRDKVFEVKKTEKPVGDSNFSAQKLIAKKRIKSSNLEAPGKAVSAPKIFFFNFDTFIILFFVLLFYVFVSIRNNFLYKNFETTKAKNVKFDDVISLYRSHGLGQTHPKLVITKFNN